MIGTRVHLGTGRAMGRVAARAVPSWLCGLWMLGLVWAPWTRVARAEAAPEPAVIADTEWMRAADSELLKRAEAAARRGAWGEVRACLGELFRRKPSLEITASLADAEFKEGDYVKAAEHARRALELLPNGSSGSAQSQRTRRALERIWNDATAQLGMLEITTTPSAAGIVLDGQPSHLMPLVMPGTHEVTAHLTGYRDASARVTVQRLQVLQVELKLEALTVLSGITPSATQSAPPTGPQRTRNAPAQPSVERGVVLRSEAPYQGRDILLVAGGAVAALAGGFGAMHAGWDSETGESYRAGTWLLASTGLSLATAISWQVWGAFEPQTSHGALARMFFTGSQPGDPGWGKVAVVGTLHASTLITLGVGIWQATTLHQRASAAARGAEDVGPVDLQRKIAVGMLASAGILHLLSEMAVEWWPNQRATPLHGVAGSASWKPAWESGGMHVANW